MANNIFSAHNKLKIKRLSRKSFSEIVYTFLKRFPTFARNYNIRKKLDNRIPSQFIPHELLKNKSLKTNESATIFPLKKLLQQSEFKKKFNFSKIIKRADSLISKKGKIFSKRILYQNGYPNWHFSIDKNKFWPLISNSKINYHDYKNFGDARYVWELNRFHHFFDLSRAYWLTKDDKYSDLIFDQILDWDEHNPFYVGINWVEGIEVSIRSINWLVAYDLTNDSKSFLKNKDKFINLLYLHGFFLENNLSDKWFTNNNHIIAELVGLVFLGNFFREYEFGTRWYNLALKKLKIELNSQIMKDGFIWESSTHYHRFITELLFLTRVLLKKNNGKCHHVVEKKYQQMANFLRYSHKPNNKLCNIGDSDDAVILKFNDTSHLKAEFLKDFNPSRYYEYGFWTGLEEKVATKKTKDSKYFSSAGIFFHNFLKNDKKIWFCFNLGNQSEKYIGAGHRHSDLLSVNLNVAGKDFIIDGGTYKYFDKKSIRNFFKGVFSHSTVSLDDLQPIKFDERFETSRKSNAISKLVSYNPTKGEIVGNVSFSRGVLNSKIFRKISYSDGITIEDYKSQETIGTLISRYQIPKGISIKKTSDREITLDDTVKMNFHSNINSRILNSFVSHSYGRHNESQILEVRTDQNKLKIDFIFH